MSDAANYAHAFALVGTIRRYWAARGYQPQIWIEERTTQKDGRKRTSYSPRSDLIGGYPVGWPKKMTVKGKSHAFLA